MAYPHDYLYPCTSTRIARKLLKLRALHAGSEEILQDSEMRAKDEPGSSNEHTSTATEADAVLLPAMTRGYTLYYPDPRLPVPVSNGYMTRSGTGPGGF